MGIIIGIVSLVLSILVLVWLHNVSLNTYKIFTLLEEWYHDYKQANNIESKQKTDKQ
jgi:hypothetical protein